MTNKIKNTFEKHYPVSLQSLGRKNKEQCLKLALVALTPLYHVFDGVILFLAGLI
jgi:hypothetical protein